LLNANQFVDRGHNDTDRCVLQVAVHLEKSGEDLQVEFPFVVATVPHKEPGGPLPDITYGQSAGVGYSRRAPHKSLSLRNLTIL